DRARGGLDRRTARHVDPRRPRPPLPERSWRQGRGARRCRIGASRVSVPLGAAPDTADVRAVEDLLRTMSKAQRALQMYLPNNPVYHRAVEQLADAFAPVWGSTGRLVLDIEENDILWEGASVLPSVARGDGLAWQLYKDGLRRLTLLPGVESEE